MAVMSHRHPTTPDSHSFAKRPYDLVKEFVIALAVVSVLTVALAAAFSSPDESAITMRGWAQAAPNDVVATAVGELAGTTASATYGPPYNDNSQGQSVLGIPLQKWGGSRIPIDSADLVLQPLSEQSGNTDLTAALRQWGSADAATQTGWATSYVEALAAAPDGDPAKIAAGSYGPVPSLATRSMSDTGLNPAFGTAAADALLAAYGGPVDPWRLDFYRLLDEFL
jgi:hypothetical protein